MTYIVSRRDYRFLNWLKVTGCTKLERYFEILMINGLSEIEAGQFINEYVTKHILIKLPDGIIKVNHGVDSNVKYDYDHSVVN